MSLENLIPTGTIQYVQTMVSSDDLSKIVCFCSGVTYVYYSSDTGITWTRADNAVDEYSMFNTGGTSNADGTQFFWVYRNVAYTFDIYKSINGLTWTKCIINDGTPVIINKITSNSSGSVVICNDRTTLYKYNTTTEIFDILKQFTNIDISTFCCSNDGLKIYVVSYGVIINYTLDGGNTWIEFTLSINGSSNNILCNNDASEIYIKIDYAESVNIYNIGNLENPIKIKTPIINKYYTNFFKSDRNCNTLIIGQSAFLFKSTDKGITWTQDVCTTPIEWSDFIFTSDLSNLICCTNSDYVYLRGNPNPPVPPIPPTPVVYDFVGKYKGVGVETTVFKCDKKKVKQVKHCLKIKKINDTSYLATFKDHNGKFNINCFLKDNKLYSGNNGYDVFYVVDNVLMLSYTPPINEDGSVSTTTFIYSKL